MDSLQIVSLLRRKVSDVDAIAGRYTDQELWEALNDARIALKGRRQTGFVTMTMVDASDPLDFDLADVEFVPEPDEVPALMLVVKAAAALLRQTLQSRLLDGSLGISWRSGTEEESSITAGQEYAKSIGGLERELTVLMGVANAPRAGTRPQ